MTDLVYQVTGLRKGYPGGFRLSIPALHVQRGEILAIVGPSGAGKSTLLRLFNFLEPHDGGWIRFLDHTVHAGEVIPLSYLRQVTTVFQTPHLLKRSVFANVAYGLKVRGAYPTNPSVDSMLERVGLSHLRNRSAEELSGGEAQRVALARALILDPVALLLDEPTANLDPYNIGLMEGILADTNRRQGTTLLMVTHNIFQARRMADRVALLLGGELVEISTAERFFTAPEDPRARAFVEGEMVY